MSWIPTYSLEESIKRLHGIGYRQAEATTAAPHAWPYYLGEKRREDIKECLKKYEMKFSAVVPYIGGDPGCNLASPDLEERQWTIQYFKDVVDVAVSFSAPLVPCMVGWVLVLFGKDRKEA
mgnify:FL=1